jgi:hypothetical protein
MIKVNVAIHTDDEYDRVCELVRASPGWEWMDMTDNGDDFEGCDPMADFAVYFDNEKNAMWFKLQIGQ